MDTEESGAGSDFSAEDNSSVRVALRIRPCLPREQIEGCKTCTTVAEGHPQVWIGTNHAFTYDHVFDQNSPQNIIFEDVVKKLVDGCLVGYNATVLAYGQTGSGKTYTMGTGFEFDPSPDTQGIIPRAVTYLFSQIERKEKECGEFKPDFKVELNFVELYNEEVIDLLGQSVMRSSSAGGSSRPVSASTGGMIRIHEDPQGSIYLVGVQRVPVASCHETLKILREGALSRTTASTNMNDTSSRSHAIFTMHVTHKRVSHEFGEAELETLTAKFHFVDLAGSERLKRTLATGDRAKEGISINCGLLALGNVISALGDRTKKISHVPYRDSKLTRLLQDSLGGNSRTVMIACVSPSDRDFVETLNTLKYANRARNIKNRVQINQDKSSRTISSLRREIELLQSELLEFKQGKRSTINSMEYNDTHQENVMLITEIESLRSRLKSKQESIDKLTETVATFETHAELKTLSETDCDLSKMIQKYLSEIETLRTKLYESEQECEKLRAKQRRLNNTLASPRQLVLTHDSVFSQESNGLLANARSEIEIEKKKLEQMTASAKAESESDEDADSEGESEQEKFEAIAQLTSEISIKELLIDQLQQSHRRVESMKSHYEEKLECLNNKIKATQDERDKVMANLKNGKRSTQVNADYEKKISSMQGEVKKWQQAQKEHIRLARNQSNYERQIEKLKSEVDSLKQTKVKLVNQSKADGAKYREMEMRRVKEINSLKKQQRVKDIKLKSLENEKIMKDQVLKRKLEEVNNLKKQNKMQMMSRSAQGRISRVMGSPVKAKSKWNTMQHEIRKSVTIKTTVSSLEKEMLNLIQERIEARKKLEELQQYGSDDEFTKDDIESLKININFLDEKISEIQNQITEVSASAKEYDGANLDEVEVRYMFKKIYEQNIGNICDVDRCERRLDDFEETNKQLNKEIASLRTLLQHMYSVQNVKELRDDDDDAVVQDFPIPTRTPEGSLHGDSNASKLKKARRLTSTPQELLGSTENVSKQEFVNPNDVFLRNSRLTQSLRVNTRRRPQLMRQDTYNVGDKKFSPLDPAEKLLTDSNTYGNNGNSDHFNTTFLIEKSPPSSASSSSSSSKITYTTESNNIICDNTNIGGGSFFRKFSSGNNKDKAMILTHIVEGHTKPVISMCATERLLFTGSKDSTVKEYDLGIGTEIATYGGHPNNVQCVNFVEDSSALFTASGSIVKLWDTRTNTCIKNLTSSGSCYDKMQSSFEGRLLQPGEAQIQSIAVLRNYLYTTFDNRIRVWDIRKLQTVGILAGKHSSNVMCLAAAQDIKLGNELRDVIVSGSKDHYIKLYVMDSNQPIESIKPRSNLNPPHYDGIESLLIKNSDLYSGSRDMCIKKWDLVNAEMTCTASNAHGGWITGLSKLPGSINLDYVLSSSRDGSVKIWDKDLKEVEKVDVGSVVMGSANYCVESLCVNSKIVFTAGGGSSNSNNVSSSNGAISLWKMDEAALLASKVRGQNESYRHPMSPRLTLNRKSNKIRYRSHEDLMTRSCGFELPY